MKFNKIEYGEIPLYKPLLVLDKMGIPMVLYLAELIKYCFDAKKFKKSVVFRSPYDIKSFEDNYEPAYWAEIEFPDGIAPLKIFGGDCKK